MTDTQTTWTINGGTATHPSGFVLAFEGHPDSNNFQVNPKRIPGNLSAPDFARLMRHGVEMYRRHYGAGSNGRGS